MQRKLKLSFDSGDSGIKKNANEAMDGSAVVCI